jgi:hypothetical protein
MEVDWEEEAAKKASTKNANGFINFTSAPAQPQRRESKMDSNVRMASPVAIRNLSFSSAPLLKQPGNEMAQDVEMCESPNNAK